MKEPIKKRPWYLRVWDTIKKIAEMKKMLKGKRDWK